MTTHDKFQAIEAERRVRGLHKDKGHTPGPWAVITRGSRDYPERGIARLEGREFHPLATVDGDIEDPMTEANARLIAAAPDLLEAARIVVEMTESLDECPHCCLGLTGHAEHCPITGLAAAIAKAEGRT